MIKLNEHQKAMVKIVNPSIEIGTKFTLTTKGKGKTEYTVVDVEITRSMVTDKTVKIEYVCQHEFCRSESAFTASGGHNSTCIVGRGEGMNEPLYVQVTGRANRALRAIHQCLDYRDCKSREARPELLAIEQMQWRDFVLLKEAPERIVFFPVALMDRGLE